MRKLLIILAILAFAKGAFCQGIDIGGAASSSSSSSGTTTPAYAWAGPYPIIYTASGQASGAALTLNSSTLATASSDLVVIAADSSVSATAALTCGGGCTNTFTHQMTDFNVGAGEFYNVWSGLAGSETSYTVTTAANNTYWISETVWHKTSGSVAFDTSAHSAISSTGLQSSCTVTTAQATAAVATNLVGSGAGATGWPVGNVGRGLLNNDVPLRVFGNLQGSSGFPSLTAFGQPVAAASGPISVYVQTANIGCIVYDVY